MISQNTADQSPPRLASVCVLRDDEGALALVHPPLVTRAMCVGGFAMDRPPIEAFRCADPEFPGSRQCDLPPGTWVADVAEVRQQADGSRCWAWRDEGRAALAAIEPSLVESFALPGGVPRCEATMPTAEGEPRGN
jgi:hypothetical protein